VHTYLFTPVGRQDGLGRTVGWQVMIWIAICNTLSKAFGKKLHQVENGSMGLFFYT